MNELPEWAYIRTLRARLDAPDIEVQDSMSGRWRSLSDWYWDDSVIQHRSRKKSWP